MSQAEIQARAETIADLFLEAHSATDIDAEAKAEFVVEIAKQMVHGAGNLVLYVVLPVLFVMMVARVLFPGFCGGHAWGFNRDGSQA